MSLHSERVIGNGFLNVVDNFVQRLGRWKLILPAAVGLLLAASKAQAQYAFTNIAFGYTLSDGVSGVAIATVPEPTSACLLAIGSLTLLRRSRRSVRGIGAE